jgi:dihydroceramidase
LAFLFELHGWWHVFTGIGGYVAVAIVDMITAGEVHGDPTGEMAFPINVVSRAWDAWARSEQGEGKKGK